MNPQIRDMFEHYVQHQLQIPLPAVQHVYAIEPQLAMQHPHCALWMHGLLTREQLLQVNNWLEHIAMLQSLNT
ncbi:MAG: hypothetical protein F6J87_15435 [Spirulina sp. SIO3F2]|nr:hypothetical protein [Spirulina sp. SIO3F2]